MQSQHTTTPSLSTGRLDTRPGHEQSPQAFWQGILAPLCAVSSPGATDGSAAGFATIHHAGGFLLLHGCMPHLELRRTPARLAQDGLDHLLLTCLLAGRAGWTDGRPNLLRQGDCIAVDLAAPFSLRTSPGFEALHLIIPRLALPAGVAPPEPMRPRRLAGGQGMARLLQGLAAALLAATTAPWPADLAGLSRPVLDLVALALGPARHEAGAGANADLRRRLRRHIEENLGLGRLTPERLCTDLRLSRSQLYRQFEGDGGVEAYIRRRRLDRSLRMLADPALAERRIGDIAYEAGFADEAHFSRLFRQHYGLSPRAFRKSGSVWTSLPTHPAGTEDPTVRFAGWLQRL